MEKLTIFSVSDLSVPALPSAGAAEDERTRARAGGPAVPDEAAFVFVEHAPSRPGRAQTDAGGQEAAARGAPRQLALEGFGETAGGVEELVAGPGYVVHAMVRPITCGAEQRAVGAMSVSELEKR